MAYVTVKDFNNTLKNISNKTLYTKDTADLDTNNLNKTINCNNFSFTDFMDLLTYKEVEINLTSNLSTTIYEVGNIVNGITLTANVIKGSSKISKIEFYKDGAFLMDTTIDVENGGNFTYTYGLDINSTTEFKAIVICEDGKTKETKLNINFYNAYYYGVTAKSINDIVDTDIVGLTKDVTSKVNKDYSFTTHNERAIIAYEKSYGLLKSILDENSFENIYSFDYKEIAIKSTPYYVYVSKTPFSITNFKYNFKY